MRGFILCTAEGKSGAIDSKGLLVAMLEGGDTGENSTKEPPPPPPRTLFRDVHLAFRERGPEKKSNVLKIT